MHKGKENVSMPLFGLPRLLPLLKPYRNRMIRMITLGLACSVIDVCYPLFNRYALDHFVAEGSMEGLPAFILLYLAVLVLQSLINNKRRDCGNVCGQRSQKQCVRASSDTVLFLF